LKVIASVLISLNAAIYIRVKNNARLTCSSLA
jgi:hypothetical protein